MNHLVGSAIKIKSEVSVVTGTTVTLDRLIDPSGNTVLSAEAMSFDEVDTDVAFMVWQSSDDSVTGKYTFVVKTVNGSYTNYAKGNFYLGARE